MADSSTQEKSHSRLLWALLFGNFIIGTGIMLPAGLLNDLTADLNVSAAVAGQLMLVGGIIVALGAPLSAAFTSRIDRRKLLVFSLALYALGHLASSFAPDFTTLLVIRALTVIGATIFTPQAAATLGLILPPEKRASGIAFIFIGWSAAAVAGIPVASFLAPLIGWRMVFACMGGVCVISVVLVLLTVKPGLFVAPLNLNAWLSALRSPVVLLVLLVTALSFSGQLTVFTYIAPILRDAFAAEPEIISIAFAAYGIAGVFGNSVASRVVGRVSLDHVIATTLFCLVLGLSVIGVGFGIQLFALIGMSIWGLGSFSSNSLQQSRLVTIQPALASATVALNTTAVYVGQAAGAALGGWLMTLNQPPSPVLAWAGAGLTALALLLSLVASQLAKQSA